MSLARYLSQLLDSSGNVKADKLVNAQAFGAGTAMLFAQTSAPTGWTKSTTHNDKALRVVSGTASSGGSVAFSTAFASGLSAGATTLSTAQMPSHNHNVTGYYGGQENGYLLPANPSAGLYPVSYTSSSTGGGGSHTHTLPNFAVQYVDVIIATKN